jgi:hypothetical protein
MLAASFAPVHIILALPCGEQKGQNPPVKDWELVADKLSKASWSLGYVSAVDSEGQTIWIVDAHRDKMAKGLSFGQMKCCQHFLNLRGSRTN